MVPVDEEQLRGPPKHLVYADFESSMRSPTGQRLPAAAVAEHTVCLAVAQIVSPKCKATWDREAQDCPACRCPHEQVFKGEDPLMEFLTWVLELPTGTTCLFHNLAGYDGQLLMRGALQLGWAPDIVNNGLRLYSIKLGNVTFKDSYLFLHCALSEFPACFGLEETKGNFPYLFPTGNNWNYVGPYPSADMYGADKMLPKKRQKLLDWLETKQGQQFNLWEELIAYCQKDTNLLRLGCQKFAD
ncbi:MAG: hypothetical protein GY738_09945, partial [Pseudoalteromonas sp.]|nr:hypothetical protein [Pseudoalteromonas sp.]